MSLAHESTAKKIKAFCAKIGTDPLLVQGAGGNVSWKDNSVLWIKASGMWLADAATKEIFVPLDLKHLQSLVASQDFSVLPRPVGASKLRPSIETFLHALMPHRIVVHLHSIEILAHLVRPNSRLLLEELLGDSINHECIEYFKPGPELALSVSNVLQKNPSVDVVFMQNHGVVIGGEKIEEIEEILFEINRRLSLRPNYDLNASIIFPVPEYHKAVYSPLADAGIPLLATEPSLYHRVQTEWCLYPDHVVFLGVKPCLYETWEMLEKDCGAEKKYPELIFIKGKGVYKTSQFSSSQHVQLRCYLDVLVRQQAHSNLCSMSDSQVLELVGWDAETYRQNQVRF